MGDDPPGDDPGDSPSSGESSSSSGDESSDSDSGKGSRHRKAKAKAERLKSGLHQAIEAVGRDVSEVAAMWSRDPLSGNALSIPLVNANLIPKHEPNSEYMLRLAKRPAGSHLPVLTARRIIDWMMKHSVSANAVPYRLLSYISEEAQTYISSAWNERSARYLPKDIQGIPCGQLTMLTNQQLLKVVQLTVRPRSQAEWVRRLQECELPPKPSGMHDFFNHSAYIEHNMAVLTRDHQVGEYLNLNGGDAYQPDWNWKRHPVHKDENQRKLVIRGCALLATRMEGTLSSGLQTFFLREAESVENEIIRPPKRYFGKRRPKTLTEAVAALQTLLRYFHDLGEGINPYRAIYEGKFMTYDCETYAKPARRFEVAQVMEPLQTALDDKDPEVIEQVRDFMSQYAEEFSPRGAPQDILHIVPGGDEAGICLSELPNCQCRHGRQLMPILAAQVMQRLMRIQGYKDAISKGWISATISKDFGKIGGMPGAKLAVRRPTQQPEQAAERPPQIARRQPYGGDKVERPPARQLHCMEHDHSEPTPWTVN